MIAKWRILHLRAVIIAFLGGWGGEGSIVPFYSVQDCRSFRAVSFFLLPPSIIGNSIRKFTQISNFRNFSTKPNNTNTQRRRKIFLITGLICLRVLSRQNGKFSAFGKVFKFSQSCFLQHDHTVTSVFCALVIPSRSHAFFFLLPWQIFTVKWYYLNISSTHGQSELQLIFIVFERFNVDRRNHLEN